jgi:hypothetical protein
MGPYWWGFLDGVACTWGFIFVVGIIGVAYERVQNQGGNQQEGGGGNQGAGGNQAV